jgi:hypothetical protein
MKRATILSAILLLTALLAPTQAEAQKPPHSAPAHHCRVVRAGLVSCPAPDPALVGAVPINPALPESVTGGTPAGAPSSESEEGLVAEGVAATGGTASS